MFSTVLSKTALFINLYKFFSKIVLREYSKIHVKLNIRAKPWRLRELQYTMNLCDTEAVTSTPLQVTIMYDVALLIVQSCEEFVLPLAWRFVARRTER